MIISLPDWVSTRRVGRTYQVTLDTGQHIRGSLLYIYLNVSAETFTKRYLRHADLCSDTPISRDLRSHTYIRTSPMTRSKLNYQSGWRTWKKAGFLEVQQELSCRYSLIYRVHEAASRQAATGVLVVMQSISYEGVLCIRQFASSIVYSRAVNL